VLDTVNTLGHAAQSMSIQVTSGSGYAYVSNRGLGNEGLVFNGTGGATYEGYAYVLVTAAAGTSVNVQVQLRNYVEGKVRPPLEGEEMVQRPQREPEVVRALPLCHAPPSPTRRCWQAPCSR